MPVRVIDFCLMIGFMIIIWDQRDDKKMKYGSINIHSTFHGLDARLFHEKFNRDYHSFIILPFIIPPFIIP